MNFLPFMRAHELSCRAYMYQSFVFRCLKQAAKIKCILHYAVDRCYQCASFQIICRIMDPRFSAQDVLRCDPCGTPVPPRYCVYCHVNLCEACAKDHLSDESKEHKVVSIEQRAFVSHYDKDAKNVTTQCDEGAHKKVEKFESDTEIRQKEIENNLIMQKKIEHILNLQKALAEFREAIFILNEYNKLAANLQMMQRLKREREEMLIQSRKSYYKDMFFDVLLRERQTAYEILPCILLFFLFLYLPLYIVCFYQYI